MASEKLPHLCLELSDVLRKAVCTALKNLDDLLVVRRVLCKTYLQLSKELATLLKSLLLLEESTGQGLLRQQESSKVLQELRPVVEKSLQAFEEIHSAVHLGI